MARRKKPLLDGSSFSAFLPPGVPLEGYKSEQRSSEVPTPALDDPIVEMNRLHTEITDAPNALLAKAIRIGQILTEKKAKLAHGEYLPWLKENAAFSQPTASRYVRIFERRDDPKYSGVNTLSWAYELLSGNDSRNAPTETVEDRVDTRAQLKEIIAESQVSQPVDTGSPDPPKDVPFEATQDGPPTSAEAEDPATKPVENKPIAKKAVAKAVQSSGTDAQLPVSVPARLLRGIITSDMYAKGFAVYSDVAGKPCQLAPDVSELEHRERAPAMIGGSGSAKHRKAYTKWEKYHGKKIRQKVLQVLELMSPLEVPKDHKAEEFVYNYDLENPDDLEELAMMLNADLMRLAQARRQILKYGTPEEPKPNTVNSVITNLRSVVAIQVQAIPRNAKIVKLPNGNWGAAGEADG
jgi:hypothetical protein